MFRKTNITPIENEILEAEAIRECYSLMKQIWESVGRKFPVSEKIFVKNWDKIKPQIYKTIKEVL